MTFFFFCDFLFFLFFLCFCPFSFLFFLFVFFFFSFLLFLFFFKKKMYVRVLDIGEGQQWKHARLIYPKSRGHWSSWRSVASGTVWKRKPCRCRTVKMKAMTKSMRLRCFTKKVTVRTAQEELKRNRNFLKHSQLCRKKKKEKEQLIPHHG